MIPKQIFWRGLLWFPAFRCWEMATLASRLSWAEPTMPRTYLLYRSYVTSLQRIQSLPATKATETVWARIPRASSFRLTSRDYSPACPAVLPTRPIPTCNKSHKNCFGGDPPRFFISTYFQRPLTCLPNGSCNASNPCLQQKPQKLFWRGSPALLHFDLLPENTHLLASRSLPRQAQQPSTLLQVDGFFVDAVYPSCSETNQN